MSVNYIQRPTRLAPDRMAIFAIVLMVLAVAVGLFLVAALNGALEGFPYLYLLPWIMGLGVVVAAPSAYLYYRGEFSFANPLVFATVSYFAPAFVLGGIFLSAGLSEPYFLSYIQDANYNLPFTVIIIGLGFAGLSIGYLVPIGSKLGDFFERVLPIADYSPRSFLVPGVLLFFLGVLNTIFAFGVGLLGYQFSNESNTYSGLIYLSTLWRNEATFLLWYILFKDRRITPFSVAVVALLLVINLGIALFAGNRGSLVEAFVITALAYIMAGRKLGFKQGAIGTAILTVCLLMGIVYGSMFRYIKGSESQQSIDVYAENVVVTLDKVGRDDTYGDTGTLILKFAERIDAVSSVAVVVSNYEQLLPYEESYGLDNNIWKDTVTFLIPRVFWPDKPVASHARLYSDLYFDFGESSFTITPMGDLLRNFGVIGVPIGMFVLGVLLRFIYRSLVEGQAMPVWRCVLYFMILTSISYESFYGLILPNLFRNGVSAVVGILFVVFLANKFERRGN